MIESAAEHHDDETVFHEERAPVRGQPKVAQLMKSERDADQSTDRNDHD